MNARNKGASVAPFVLDNDLRYDWTVKVHVPTGKGGRAVTKFTATFQHVSPERRNAILTELREQLRAQTELRSRPVDADEADEASAEEQLIDRVLSYEHQLLSEVLVGFKGIKTPAGGDLEYSPETRDQLLANSWARSALMAAYQQSLQSRDDRGN